ncbi:MAG: hypothetical protein R3B72_27640 [Polyangiaceae bacterium]
MKRFRLLPQDAVDVVQEAITQFLAGAPSAGLELGAAELMMGVGSRINGIMANRRRKRIDQAARPTRDGSLPDQSDGGGSEDRLVGKADASKALDLLLERVAGDELLTEAVLAADAKPGELAHQLGVSAATVYNARRRLDKHVQALRLELEAAE